ncbi:MAG: hypothetical protein ACSHWQ_03585 [Spongiibacteraceae bacterium]
MTSLASSIKRIVSTLAIGTGILFVSGVCAADEAAYVIEEITVVGAVRASQTRVITDIDLAGDEELAEMPVAYE